MNISSNKSTTKSSAHCIYLGYEVAILTPMEWIDICQLRCALRQRRRGHNPTLLARDQKQQPSLSAHINWQPPVWTLSHFWSHLRSWTSGHGSLVCVTPCLQLAQQRERAMMARRSQTTSQCANLHVHRLLCFDLQHHCSSHSMDLSFTMCSTATCLHKSLSSSLVPLNLLVNSRENKSRCTEKSMGHIDVNNDSDRTSDSCKRKATKGRGK